MEHKSFKLADRFIKSSNIGMGVLRVVELINITEVGWDYVSDLLCNKRGMKIRTRPTTLLNHLVSQIGVRPDHHRVQQKRDRTGQCYGIINNEQDCSLQGSCCQRKGMEDILQG